MWYGILNKGSQHVSHVSVSEGIVRNALNRLRADKVVMVCRENRDQEWQPLDSYRTSC